MSNYESFLARKRVRAVPTGFKVDRLDTEALFPFQADTVRWALELGRAAVFAETGLGKGPMLLTWAHHVAKHTGGKVLVLAPLAVGPQLVREAYKFGVSGAHFGKRPTDYPDDATLWVTNYNSLDHFDGIDFAGVVLDESGILKNFAGKMSQHMTRRFATTPYRLCCSATPSPNDHVELGMHSDFLGYGTTAEMKATFFVNDSSNTQAWRLKRHAIKDFWRWVASWARAITKPGDVNPAYDDTPYALPPLVERLHIVDTDITKNRKDGELFRRAEMSATSYHAERRLTATERAAKVAELVSQHPDEQWLLWAETDYDCDAVRSVMPGVVEVKGSDSDERKETALLGFSDGTVKILLTKPKIAGFGMNWQGCHRICFVGPSHSFESYYQSVRRCYRFGQTRPVEAHVVSATTEANVWNTVREKEGKHHEMRNEMLEASRAEAYERGIRQAAYIATHTLNLPTWVRTK